MARPRKENGEFAQPGEHIPNDKTRQFVADLYLAGIPKIRIAEHMKIDVDTLNKHYYDDLDHGLDTKVSILCSNLYQDALNGDKKDREFFLRTRGGFTNAQPAPQAPTVSNADLVEFVKSRIPGSTCNND